MSPAPIASTKAECNQCKKENAKKRKAEDSQKQADEEELLEQMSTVTLVEDMETTLDTSCRLDSPPQCNSSSKDSSPNTLPSEKETQ
jgi:hypothetical protein